jgi:indole-3-glycerol phosphate synthase
VTNGRCLPNLVKSKTPLLAQRVSEKWGTRRLEFATAQVKISTLSERTREGLGTLEGLSPQSLIIKRFFMAAILERIVAATRARVAETRRGADLRLLEQTAERHVPRGFRAALKARSREGVAVIAELKKASPSKGLIREDFRPAELARELEAVGAAALSVLTDEEFFQGSLGNLRNASAAVTIPCLRKDFIVDEFQLVEARAHCADAVLLIVAALHGDELSSLAAAARRQGLDVLCEVHDREELQRALDAGFDLIGVNTRDLRTFTVDLQTAFALAVLFPANVVRVAESGIHSAEDVAQLRGAGYDAFLVGESLMRAASPGEALRGLMVPSTRYSVPSTQ